MLISHNKSHLVFHPILKFCMSDDFIKIETSVFTVEASVQVSRCHEQTVFGACRKPQTPVNVLHVQQYHI